MRSLTLPLLFSTLLLAGCGVLPHGKADRNPRPEPAAATSAFSSTSARQCLADLGDAGVRYQALPNREFGGGCRTVDTVQLLDIGVPTTNLGALTCPLAAGFSAWARYAVQPAARQMLGSDVVKIETMGTYACRNINGAGSGKLSQHALANAVDVSAFVLRDGRRVSVERGWNGDPREQAFLHALHASACRRFGTVLGPDYNSAHYNHLHFDMSGNGYCR